MASKLLNAITVRDIKPDVVERIHRDGNGLELRVYPSGGKIWQLRYQFGTTRRIMRLGEYPALSLAGARIKADDAHKLFDAGTDPKAYAEEQEQAKIEAVRIAKMEQAARKTFSDVFIEWNSTKLSKRKDGENLLRAIRKDILPTLGEKEIGAVTRADLMKCLDSVTSRGSPRMANVLLNALKTFYGWAQLREIVSADPLGPVRAADVGGKLPSRDRVLSDAEIVDLFRKLPECGLSPMVQTALLISLATGCRIGEICAAEWAHVTDTTWIIPTENAKNGKEHKITLSPFAQGLFRTLQTAREGKWCMPSPKKIGSHQTRMSVGAALYDRQTEAAQRQGRTAATGSLVLEGGHWTAHDLRRTCASGCRNLA